MPGPGVNFTSIQAAVNAAADRDIILVKAGGYGSFTITGKALVIVADSFGSVNFGDDSAISISGTAPWQPVVLRGFGFPFASHAEGPRVTAVNCAGPLWFEDCAFGVGIIPGNGSTIHLTSCDSVVLDRCSVFGQVGDLGFPLNTKGGNALVAFDSFVQAFDSKLKGGNGGPSTLVGFNGGWGASIVNGSLFAARCDFVGGKGGGVMPPVGIPGTGGNGANGLQFTGATTLLNCTAAGGMGGPGAYGGSSGGNGVPIYVSGPYTPLTGPNFRYFVDSPVREHQSINLRFDLQVPADTYLFLAPDPGLPVDVPGFFGPLLLDLAAMGYVGFGVMPQGLTTISIPAGLLPPTLQGAVLSTQAIFIDPNLTFIEIGPPSHLLVLDSVF